jgi:hypothetical protein
MNGRWMTLWRRRHLVAEAAGALLRANCTVLLARGQRLARSLGDPAQDDAPAPTASELTAARDVGWAVELLAVRGPLRTACLGQALAARRLLQRRGIRSTLTLGLRRQDDGGLGAHAWVRVGGQTITGGRGRNVFAPIAGFR